MHTVELLDQAVALAQSLGYAVRQDWLGGGGGSCEVRGRKWLFVDLALTPAEQLGQVLDALQASGDMDIPPGDAQASISPAADEEPRATIPLRISPELRRAIRLRKSA